MAPQLRGYVIHVYWDCYGRIMKYFIAYLVSMLMTAIKL